MVHEFELEILDAIIACPNEVEIIPRETFDTIMEFLIENEEYEKAAVLKSVEGKCVERSLKEVMREHYD